MYPNAPRASDPRADTAASAQSNSDVVRLRMGMLAEAPVLYLPQVRMVQSSSERGRIDGIFSDYEAKVNDGDHVILCIPTGRSRATCIKIWERGKAEWVMSTSSGPKNQFVNFVMALFDANPSADSAALMSLPGPRILFLLRIDGAWTDNRGVRPRILDDL